MDKSPITSIGEIVWGEDGFLYVADDTGDLVKISPEGELFPFELWRDHQTFRDEGPSSIAFDADGNLYLANGSQAVKLLPTGEIERIPGVQGGPIGDIMFGPDGLLYFTNRNEVDGGVYRLPSLESTEPEEIAQLPSAEMLAFSTDGYLYVSQMNIGVKKIDLETKKVTPFGHATTDPTYLAIDKEGDIWVRDLGGLTQYSPSGVKKAYQVRTGDDWISGDAFAWNTSTGIAFDPEGNFWVSSFISAIWKLTPTDPEQPDPDFELHDIYEGMRVTGMDFGPDNELYAYDENSENLYRYLETGEKELIYDFGNVVGPGKGPGLIAIDSQGNIFVGVAGEISRFDKDLRIERFASISIQSMVVGKDDLLYAISQGKEGSPGLIRIDEGNQIESITTNIQGRNLSREGVSLASYGKKGFLIHDYQKQTTYFVDYEGNSRIFRGNYGNPWIGSIAVSPTTEDIFLLDLWDIKWISGDGEEAIPYAKGISGDGTMMVVSPDGKWIYYGPNGAIGKIPIVDFWWQIEESPEISEIETRALEKAPAYISVLCGEETTIVESGTPVILKWAWGAATKEQVIDHLSFGHHMTTLNGEIIEGELKRGIYKNINFDLYGVSYRSEPLILEPGLYPITHDITWDKMIEDGSSTYGPGGATQAIHRECELIIE